MKKVIALLMTAALAVSLCGCFPFREISKEIAEAQSELKEAESELKEGISELQSDLSDSSDSSDNYDSSYDYSSSNVILGDTQIIGNEDFGWMKVPADFLLFKDVEGGDDLQYSDKIGSTIFTLNRIDNADDSLTQTQAAENLAAHFKTDGALNVTIDDVDVNGFSGKKIECYYSDVHKTLEVYLIPFIGYINYISVEYTAENADMADYVQTWQSYPY